MFDILGILQSLFGLIAKKFKLYFWQSSYELATSCDSYYYIVLHAIERSLSSPRLFQWLSASKLEKEFSERLSSHYLAEFAKEKQLTGEEFEKFKIQVISQCRLLKQQRFFIFQNDMNRHCTDEELVELLAPGQSSGLTNFVLNRIARVGCISEASYTFVFSICSVHDTPFMCPTLATFASFPCSSGNFRC